MIRAFAICAVVFASGFARAETSSDEGAAPQPTVALSSPGPVSACGKTHCPDAAHEAAVAKRLSDEQMLKQKLAELNCLQCEIDRLRRSIGTPQQVLIKVKVLEVSRTKMRQRGIELASFESNTKAPSKNIDQAYTPRKASPKRVNLHVVDDSARFQETLKLLQGNGLTKIVAEPCIVTSMGRPASFQVGEQLPALPGWDQSQGVRELGTKVDVLATEAGENRVRLELRVKVSEADHTHTIVVDGKHVPGIKVRQCDSPIELELGQTGVLSGSIQRRTVVTETDAGQVSEDEEFELLFVVSAEPIRDVVQSLIR
jgi:Flp pilus assembly secretin CpaC